jgi:hypothetical protein
LFPNSVRALQRAPAYLPAMAMDNLAHWAQIGREISPVGFDVR